jgi:hypothetical protein
MPSISGGGAGSHRLATLLNLATELELPVLLDLPAPRLRAYPRETSSPKSFRRWSYRAVRNSRMNDLHDIWVPSRSYEFSDDGLARAIAATFARQRRSR